MSLITKGKLQSLSDKRRRTTKALHSLGSAISGLSFGFIVVCLLAAGNAEAASFSFTKVVDTNTPVPGSTLNFSGFGEPPALDNGSVAFRGNSPFVPPFSGPLGSFITGIYTNLGGSLKVVVDPTTSIPSSTQNFAVSNLYRYSIENGNVAFTVFPFRSFVSGGQAIYTDIGGSLSLVADSSTPRPGGIGNFSIGNSNGGGFSQPSLDNGSVAFSNTGGQVPFSSEFAESGIYTTLGGSLNVIADRNTPIPGGIGNFTSLGAPSLDNGSVAFIGFRSVSGETVQQGIYTNLGGSLNFIADLNTPIPNGIGNFTSLGAPSLDNGSVAFIGSRFGFKEPEQQGIYTTLGGSLNVIADLNTPIPGGTGNFTREFQSVSLNNGNIAFASYNPDTFSIEGIYTTLGGSLTKVIDINDSLDGKTIRAFYFGPEGFSGNEIAFVAIFTDFSSGIYIATLNPTSVPEPSTALGFLAIGACGASSMLRRKYK